MKLAEKISIIKASFFHLKIYIGIIEMQVSLVHSFSVKKLKNKAVPLQA